ncbi:hypothetical protein QP330_05965 [Actinotignum timonense]|uniref:hypothetical protein n=1 Tax=Actinotignum timonense TaxID=1870995 RepID=UPI0025513F61|nr:hypothetical protein [Actinotignum timonense]
MIDDLVSGRFRAESLGPLYSPSHLFQNRYSFARMFTHNSARLNFLPFGEVLLEDNFGAGLTLCAELIDKEQKNVF